MDATNYPVSGFVSKFFPTFSWICKKQLKIDILKVDLAFGEIYIEFL